MGQPGEDGGSLLGPEATVLRLLGLWRPQERAYQVTPFLLAAATFAVIALIIAGAVLRLGVYFPDQLEETAQCSYICFFFVGFIVKAALFIVEGGTVRELVHLLYAMRAEYGTDEGSDRIRCSYQGTVDRFYRYFQVMATLPTLFWICSPLLASAAIAPQDAPAHQGRLPLPFWLLSGFSSTPAYQLLYAVQAISLTVVVASSISLDVFFIRLMMMVAAELHVLNDKISALDSFHASASMDRRANGEYDALVRISDRAGEPTKKSAGNVSDNEILSQLLNNILHHQVILRCIWMLQTAMNVSIFILLFLNMANLCFNIFVTAALLQGERNVTKAVKPFSTVPGLLLQTAMYCLFGQITTDQNEKLLYSAFGCGWDNCDTRIKRNLLFFMMMVARPVEITVGKTYKLSKEMLLQVLNGTYILLNMLLQLHSDS